MKMKQLLVLFAYSGALFGGMGVESLCWERDTFVMVSYIQREGVCETYQISDKGEQTKKQNKFDLNTMAYFSPGYPPRPISKNGFKPIELNHFVAFLGHMMPGYEGSTQEGDPGDMEIFMEIYCKVANKEEVWPLLKAEQVCFYILNELDESSKAIHAKYEKMWKTPGNTDPKLTPQDIEYIKKNVLKQVGNLNLFDIGKKMGTLYDAHSLKRELIAMCDAILSVNCDRYSYYSGRVESLKEETREIHTKISSINDNLSFLGQQLATVHDKAAQINNYVYDSSYKKKFRRLSNYYNSYLEKQPFASAVGKEVIIFVIKPSCINQSKALLQLCGCISVKKDEEFEYRGSEYLDKIIDKVKEEGPKGQSKDGSSAEISFENVFESLTPAQREEYKKIKIICPELDDENMSFVLTDIPQNQSVLDQLQANGLAEKIKPEDLSTIQIADDTYENPSTDAALSRLTDEQRREYDEIKAKYNINEEIAKFYLAEIGSNSVLGFFRDNGLLSDEDKISKPKDPNANVDVQSAPEVKQPAPAPTANIHIPAFVPPKVAPPTITHDSKFAPVIKPKTSTSSPHVAPTDNAPAQQVHHASQANNAPKSEASSSFCSTVFWVISWPFVTIYQLFVKIYQLFCWIYTWLASFFV